MHKRTILLKEFEKISNQHQFKNGLPFILNDRLRFKNFSIYAEKHSMTGLDNIDSIIEQVLYILLIFIIFFRFYNIF